MKEFTLEAERGAIEALFEALVQSFESAGYEKGLHVERTEAAEIQRFTKEGEEVVLALEPLSEQEARLEIRTEEGDIWEMVCRGVVRRALSTISVYLRPLLGLQEERDVEQEIAQALLDRLRELR